MPFDLTKKIVKILLLGQISSFEFFGAAFLLHRLRSAAKNQAFQGSAIATFDAAKLLTNRLRRPLQSLPQFEN